MKALAKYLTHPFRKSNMLMLAIVVMVGMALCSLNTLAQSGAGSIQGTVTDSTGAVIPGASVHVVNQSTSVASDTKSNGVGYYQVPDLFTGTYVVTVSAPNMKSYKTTVELQASQEAVINPSLTAGACDAAGRGGRGRNSAHHYRQRYDQLYSRKQQNQPAANEWAHGVDADPK